MKQSMIDPNAEPAPDPEHEIADTKADEPLSHAESRQNFKTIYPLVSRLRWNELLLLKGLADDYFQDTYDKTWYPTFDYFLLSLEPELQGEVPTKFSPAAIELAKALLEGLDTGGLWRATRNKYPPWSKRPTPCQFDQLLLDHNYHGDEAWRPSKEKIRAWMVKHGHAVEAFDEVWTRYVDWRFPHSLP